MIYITFNKNFYIYYALSRLEFQRIENFLKLCNRNKKFEYNKNPFTPKISIISPIHNGEKYLHRLLNCIQHQNFNLIEVIMVDDYSKDNSIRLIEKYKKNDRRIRLIKNKQNKGTFIARNIGIIYSKGKYLIAPDPDDIISKHLLDICFKSAEKYNFDIIRFNMYIGQKKLNLDTIIKKLGVKPIYQPELSTIAFYGSDELWLIDFTVCNKFIRKDAFIKALNILNNYYLNMYITYSEDTLINYILYRVSKSYIFFNKIGYYYIKNYLSITNNLFKKSKIKIQFVFVLLKFIFEYSKNTKYEKDMSNLLFTKLIKEYNTILINNKKKFLFFSEVINAYLDSEFIEKNNKKILKKIYIEKNFMRN